QPAAGVAQAELQRIVVGIRDGSKQNVVAEIRRTERLPRAIDFRSIGLRKHCALEKRSTSRSTRGHLARLAQAEAELRIPRVIRNLLEKMVVWIAYIARR